MSKLTTYISALFIFCFQLSAVAQVPAQAEVQKELAAVLQAPYQDNFDLMLDHMHPNLIKASGTKEGLKEAIKAIFAKIKAAGVDFVSAKVGAPYSYMKSAQREYFLVDVTLVLSKGEQEIPSKITQIVIRDIGSKVWTYTDTSGMDEAFFRKIFPDAPKEFSPKKKEEPAKEPVPQP